MQRPPDHRPTIALCHPWLGLGGSEAAVMWGIEALRDDYDITLVTASRVDLGKLNAAYGTSVAAGDFHLLRAPALPAVRNPSRLAHWRVKRFEQFCRTNTGAFDIPLSAYNPIDFGRPGIHLVGDFSWDDSTRSELFGGGAGGQQIRRGYLWLGSRLFGTSGRDILNGHDLVVANSDWTSRTLAERFGLSGAPVLYPPVHASPQVTPTQRRKGSFVCLGRVSPEKGIERLIEILARVRDRGHEEVRLTIVGAIGDDEYGQRIAELVQANCAWVNTPGYVGSDEKFKLLGEHEFGIHACEGEAFGIAVAEMLMSGCLPFVPASGGAVEIVRDEALCYRDRDDAVEKICAALAEREDQAGQRGLLLEGAIRFAPKTFMEQLHTIVRRFHHRNQGVRAA